MLAHLHANLNFAIYSFGNRTVRAAYRRLAVRVVASCRQATSSNPDAVATVAYGNRINAPRTPVTEVDLNRSLVAVECHQLHEGD